MATTPLGTALPPAPSAIPTRRRWLRRGSDEGSKARPEEVLSAYLFLLPYLFVLGVFFLFVSLYGVGLSLFSLDIGFTAPTFVGLHNYEILFNHLSNIGLSDFWTSMINILKFVVVIVTDQTILALILAIILQSLPFARGIFRTIFYIPALTS